ncbi:uncharacterized protein MYCFIDRAFT_214561 [Pseudocercospora fijiensis CIRAD86]|uniref:Uncharacterized protein n=1 Tax=Pseudocercospora fijiensis (strain CIRAD86) TaxID=383855 RepID=M3B3M4_PSEFD|nr:uncharacterized protein MYCFIDRAFT_214561 [Pseudocercospora fijiensis CIRAD86]EME83972.1 hypothetical protein MYCFIDRAFT_214561 [Pseudocercospora fijiensis CIRAD86]
MTPVTCQQQELLLNQHVARADENANAATAWTKKAEELQAELERKQKEWNEEKESIDQQNQSNINELNRTHLQERGDLRETADKAKAEVAKLLSTEKLQAACIIELEKTNSDRSSQIEQIGASRDRFAATLLLHGVRRVQDRCLVKRLEESRDQFAARLLLQGVRCVQTDLLVRNTAARLISRNWKLRKTRCELQQSEADVKAERQGYAQASEEYSAELKLRKQSQKRYDDVCAAHRDSVEELHDAQAQVKIEAAKSQQEQALREGLNETLRERTRQFNEKSLKCNTLLDELESCRLQLSENKRTQEQESKRAQEAEANAVMHLNARKGAEKERDELKTWKGTLQGLFFDRSREDDSSGLATKHQEHDASTTDHGTAKAVDKVSEPLIDNEGHDPIRKNSHSPERNAIDKTSNDNLPSTEIAPMIFGQSGPPATNKKRQADGKLPQAPKKKHKYNSSASRNHEIYHPPT